MKERKLKNIMNKENEGEYFLENEGRELKDWDVMDGMLKKGIEEREYW